MRTRTAFRINVVVTYTVPKAGGASTIKDKRLRLPWTDQVFDKAKEAMQRIEPKAVVLQVNHV